MTYESNYLAHYGIAGQKWGVRRFQNEDGTLTEEGKRRYYEINDTSVRVHNEAVEKTNKDLKAINKKYNNVDLGDDNNNLNYSREVRDAWQKNYREVLAKDIGVDSSSLVGQKWLDDVLGYKTNIDDEIKELEKKINKKKKSEQNTKISVSSKSSVSQSHMTSKQAIKKAYSDLEKKYPNFNDLPLDKQDKLFIDYINNSGLYKYI